MVGMLICFIGEIYWDPATYLFWPPCLWLLIFVCPNTFIQIWHTSDKKGSWYEMSIRSQIFLNGKAFSYSWHDLSDLIYSRNGYVWHNAWGKHEDLKHLVTVGVSGHLSYMPQNRHTFVARCLIVMPEAVPGFIFKHIFRASRPEMGGVVVLVSGGGGSGGWVGV